MEKYTDEELEMLISSLNATFLNSTYLFEDNADIKNYIIDVLSKYVKIPNFSQELQKVAEENDFDLFLEKLEEMYEQILHLVPQDKYVEFLRGLDKDNFEMFFREKRVKDFPELLVLVIEKSNEFFPHKFQKNNKKTFVSEIFEEIDAETQKRALEAILTKNKTTEKSQGDNILTNVFNILELIDESILEDGSIYELLSPEDMEFLFRNSNTDITKVILGYTKHVLSKDKYAITNNDFVSHLHQGIKNGIEMSFYNKILGSFFKSDRNIDEIKAIFEQISNETQEPIMTIYEDRVNTLSEMSLEEFDRFIEDLKKYRNIHGEFPERYCDYLIKQKLNSASHLNQNLDKYFPILKRAFEDKGLHILRRDNIENYLMRVSDSAFSEMNGGLTADTWVQISERHVRSMCEKNAEPINTLFHECRHVYQKERISKYKYKNGIDYNILKEDTISLNDAEYYKENYEGVTPEVDARIIALKRFYEYLQQLGFSKKQISEMDKTLQGKSYDEIQRLEIKNLKFQRRINPKKRKQFSVNTRFSEIVRNEPQIIQEFPILSMEFDNDGKRKPSFQILQQYEEALAEVRQDKTLASKNHISLYPTILKAGCIVDGERAFEELEYLQIYEPSNEVMRSYRDYIIRTQMLDFVRVWGRKQEISVTAEESREDRRENFKKYILGLNDFAINNPDESISKAILQVIEQYLPSQEEKTLTSDIQALDIIDSQVSPTDRVEGMNMLQEINRHLAITELERKKEDRTDN